MLCVCSVFLTRTLTLGLVLLVVPFLPASNIFFRVGFVIAERVLYLSSAGYCLLLAYSLGHCCCRWSKYRVRLNDAKKITIKQRTPYTEAVSSKGLFSKVVGLNCLDFKLKICFQNQL